MTVAISVESLMHAFDRHTIIDKLSFTVELGRFFILIGPNGSGKTTLLKLLAGLLPLQSGTIRINDRPIKDNSPRQLARQVAYVPQSLSVDFPFRVIQVVLMGRAPHLGLLGFESQKDVEMAYQAMAFTDVAHLADRRLETILARSGLSQG